MKKEIHASHLLITLPDQPPPEDTLTALEKISEIRRQIDKGLDFNEAAVRFSQDPSAAANRGDLGWFTVFQMVYPFENAAFTTAPGNVSMPFRTRFGYHLVKVNDIRDSEGEILVAHIMISYPPEASPEQKEAAFSKADTLYRRLTQGADFAELAMKYSDDKRTGSNGGQLPWFSRSQMIPEFANPSFNLEKNGDITKPVDSGFGYHIIKRIDKKAVPPFGEVKNELQERIRKDSERSIHSRTAFITKLKNEYNFTRNQAAVDALIEKSADWFRDEERMIPNIPEENPVLFSYADTVCKAEHWVEYLKKLSVTTELANPQRMAALYGSWENEAILAYEDRNLEKKHPEFRSLMQEYHDGMLLFAISEDKIWQRASADTAGLEAFYETNKFKYMWDDRYQGLVIRCISNEVKEKVETYLDAGIPVNEMYDLGHILPGQMVVTEGVWSEKENPVIDYYFRKGEKPKDWDDETGIVKAEKVPPVPKLLNETRGYHIADYQQFLEQKWIQELHRKYPVKVNKKLLKSLDNG
jgi:peptidyl-prolyl cis-trans isomerase SurA